MKIKIERSGGFAGIISSKEVNTNNLPSSVGDAVRSILKSKVNSVARNSAPRGSADHLNYKITIEDGNRNQVIECNQYNIDEKLKFIISYVEKDYEKKKNSS